MKTTLKLVAVAAMALGMATQSRGAALDFYLEYDAGGTWALSVSTDHADGIAAFVADLANTTGGTSVAPEGFQNAVAPAGATGYVNGNIFASGQAFAGQNTVIPNRVILGIGFAPVPDSAFGILIAKGEGNANADRLPTYDGHQVLVYTGTWDTGGPAPGFDALQPDDYGTLVGPLGESGTGEPGDPIITVRTTIAPTERSYTVVPEPATFVLAGLAIPALAFALRRRKTA